MTVGGAREAKMQSLPANPKNQIPINTIIKCQSWPVLEDNDIAGSIQGLEN